MKNVFFYLPGIEIDLDHSLREFHGKLLWDVFPELQATQLIMQNRKHWLKDAESMASIKFKGPQSLLALASTFLTFKKQIKMIFYPYKEICDFNGFNVYTYTLSLRPQGHFWPLPTPFIFRRNKDGKAQQLLRDKTFDRTFNPSRIPRRRDIVRCFNFDGEENDSHWIFWHMSPVDH
jgi:hypothetical protein